jgi:SAM-dependent methyltransferase
MTGPKSEHQTQADIDYLWQNLRDLPYFRALLRAVEAQFYDDITLSSPTLDLGCGDGHFATVAFSRQLEIGIDPWWHPLKEAAARHVYLDLLQSEGSNQPFPDEYFESAVSNSVLEHIPDLKAVLLEVQRVLKPGSLFVFCVPNHRFLAELSVGKALDHIGFGFLGKHYRSFFNRISRHYHCDSPEVWLARLAKTGFHVEKWWHYFSPKTLQTLEWGHYFGLPSLILKKITGRWILIPKPWNLSLICRLLRKSYQTGGINENGVYTFYITRKK